MASFSIDLQEYARKTGKKLDEVTTQAKLELSNEIMRRTPVLTGNLVNNWKPSVVAPNTATSERTGGFSPLRGIPKGDVYFFTNSVKYAKSIEFGKSRIKAPAGMVRVSVRNFRKALRDAIKRA